MSIVGHSTKIAGNETIATSFNPGEVSLHDHEDRLFGGAPMTVHEAVTLTAILKAAITDAQRQPDPEPQPLPTTAGGANGYQLIYSPNFGRKSQPSKSVIAEMRSFLDYLEEGKDTDGPKMAE